MTVLTGFLGSGKTTILNGLVRNEGLRRTAVVINEFGQIGLDHELVQRSDENFVLVRNGCICCTVRGDLVSTLQDLSARQESGDIERLERVVIETTGLADPAPILHTLMNDQSLIERGYGLGAVVTTIDAVNGLETLENHQEAVKQLGVADLLLLTKTDLTSSEAVSGLCTRIAAINPGAKVVLTINGEIRPDDFFSTGLYRLEGKTTQVHHWLNAEAYAGSDAHEHTHRHDASAEHDPNRHGERIKAFCVTREQPISWAGFSAWLDLVSGMRGNDLLRVKGIINVAEHPSQPVVIHGVQHIFHPPIQLEEWPSEDHRTRIVFITRDIEQDTIEQTLRVFERRRTKKQPV